MNKRLLYHHYLRVMKTKLGTDWNRFRDFVWAWRGRFAPTENAWLRRVIRAGKRTKEAARFEELEVLLDEARPTCDSS